tara:strand:- start:92 stop:727 length:636 start_codon:yes stop_codon:yes gene_type:complete
MKIKILITIVLFGLISCKPQMDYVWSKKGFDGKNMKKIAVIVVSKDVAARSTIENRIVNDLKDNGVDAISGLSFLPPNASESDWETKRIAEKLKELGADGAISVSLISSNDKTEYVSGQSYIYPNGYYRYGRYVYRNYGNVYSPGYYEKQTEYLIESRLYDVTITSDKESALLWMGQSSLLSPSSLKDAARSYGDNLIAYLIKNELIIKKD